MADRILPLDTMVDGDVSTTVDSTQAFRITAIGSDSSSTITPTVNGDDLGTFVTELGDIHPRNTAMQGLMQLGTPPNADDSVVYPYGVNREPWGPNLYYYIPPDATFELDGASGDHVRLQGQRLDGVDDRFESSADQTRFEQQGEYHYTVEEGTANLGQSFNDGTTNTVHTINPATDETIDVVGPQMIAQTTNSFATDDDIFDVFWDMDGQRLPSQFNDDEIFTVDFQVMERPPDDTNDSVPFVWQNYGPSMQPLRVQGDQTLDINVRNVSGSNQTNGSDVTWTYTAQVVFDERR